MNERYSQNPQLYITMISGVSIWGRVSKSTGTNTHKLFYGCPVLRPIHVLGGKEMTSISAQKKPQSIDCICDSTEFRSLIEQTCHHGDSNAPNVHEQILELFAPTIDQIAGHLARESGAPHCECAETLQQRISCEVLSTNWNQNPAFVRLSLQRRITLQIPKVRSGIRHTRALSLSF